ncbi:MAG: hypothetical protein ACREBM_08980 [Sphingomicrobium sp.]
MAASAEPQGMAHSFVPLPASCFEPSPEQSFIGMLAAICWRACAAVAGAMPNGISASATNVMSLIIQIIAAR